MECVQGAFKNGFGTETASFVEDFSAVVHGGWTHGDDLFVDELLDFSNAVVCETEEQPPLHEPEGRELQEQKAESSVSVEQQSVAATDSSAQNDQFGSLPTDPVEGLESLEWVSRFVDESFTEYSLAGKLHPNPVGNRSELAAGTARPCFATPVQTKARTKRARSGVRVWPVLSSSSSTSSSSSSSNSSTTSFPVRFEPARKRRRADAASQQQPRKCSHCGVTKTPQWRAGPLGLKTLCNACGVRFKSGRLLPEYRPACSPTFSSELHSNSHRKVLEMRMKKESETVVATGLAKPGPKF